MSDVNGQTVVNGVVQTGGVGGAVPAQGVSVVQNPQGTVPVQQQNTQAVFTQEQLNSIVQGRVNTLKSQIDDLSNQLAQSQNLAKSYLEQLTQYQHRESATNAGVAPKFVKFAIFEAQQLAINGKSFDDALKEYVQANPHITATYQMGSQPSQPTTPAGGQATQVVANPAQGAQQPTGTLANTGVATAVVQNPAGVGGVGGAVVQPNTGVSAGQVVQIGGTGVGTATTPTAVNAVESQVDAFLKERGLKK